MNLETLTPAPRSAGSCVTDASGSPVPTCAPRILVADDDELIRQLVCTTLVDGGFDVKAVADGEQAWEALHREHFDLLVADNEMPRLTGVKLSERILNEGLSLPVIMASGTFRVDQARNAGQLQIAAVLPKPFDLLELLDTVRHALPAAGESTAACHATFPPSPQPIP